MRIYVAGPYRAKNAWEIERNIRKAEEAGLELARNGWTPIIPHTMYRFFQGTLTDEKWIEITKDLVRGCDVILFLPHWKDSEGSQGEFKVAYNLGHPMYFLSKEGVVKDENGHNAEPFKPFEYRGRTKTKRGAESAGIRRAREPARPVHQARKEKTA
jgi:hypothetical protein